MTSQRCAHRRAELRWRARLGEAMVIVLPTDAPVRQSTFGLLVAGRPTAEMPVGPA